MKPLIRKPLRKGSLVYHGTSADQDFVDLVGPAWISDAQGVARTFVSWGGGSGVPRVMVFEVRRAPSLAVAQSDREWVAFQEWVNERTGLDEPINDPFEFAEWICNNRGSLAMIDGWHIPTNYPEGSDTLICEPEQFLKLVTVEPVDVEALKAERRKRGYR